MILFDQTHYSILPPLIPSRTVWGNFSDAQKRSSVDSRRPPRDFGTQRGWGISGDLKARWEQRPGGINCRIQQYLNDDGSEIFSHQKTRSPVILHLYMVGDDLTTAYPTLVVCNAKLRLAQKIINVIKKVPCLLHFGLRLLACKTPVFQPGPGMSSTMDQTEYDGAGGIPIIIPACPFIPISTPRRATIGGLILINNSFYGLTVAHPFLGLDEEAKKITSIPAVPDSKDNRGSWDEIAPEEGSDTTGLEVDSLDVFDDIITGTDVILNARALPHIMSIESASEMCQSVLTACTQKIGYLPDNDLSSASSMISSRNLTSPWVCRSLDWALVRVTHPDFLSPPGNHLENNETVLPVDTAQEMPTGNREVLINRAGDGPVKATFSGSVCSIWLPGSSSLEEAWSLNFTCRPGDCGTWIVDPVDRTLCGMVVAANPTMNLTYVLPAKRIFESIKERFSDDEIQFPTEHPRFTNPIKIHSALASTIIEPWIWCEERQKYYYFEGKNGRYLKYYEDGSIVESTPLDTVKAANYEATSNEPRKKRRDPKQPIFSPVKSSLKGKQPRLLDQTAKLEHNVPLRPAAEETSLLQKGMPFSLEQEPLIQGTKGDKEKLDPSKK
ncbi:MAG: hypothetical protein M1834_003118 [Cirrosporium novae-zelandiae]|nr:MAG: hypothetical protein M1834_003118 [Cirrosporium novae-zelandiae]